MTLNNTYILTVQANWTTLLTAADNCQFDIVKLLLERGAKPNEMSKVNVHYFETSI